MFKKLKLVLLFSLGSLVLLGNGCNTTNETIVEQQKQINELSQKVESMEKIAVASTTEKTMVNTQPKPVQAVLPKKITKPVVAPIKEVKDVVQPPVPVPVVQTTPAANDQALIKVEKCKAEMEQSRVNFGLVINQIAKVSYDNALAAFDVANPCSNYTLPSAVGACLQNNSQLAYNSALKAKNEAVKKNEILIQQGYTKCLSQQN